MAFFPYGEAPGSRLSTESAVDPSALGGTARRFGEALRAADPDRAIEIATAAYESGMSLAAVYSEILQPAMYWVGDLWQCGDIGVGDEHVATSVTEQAIAALQVHLLDVREPPSGRRILLAAVEGERHGLGLRMVADVFRQRGDRVLNLGEDAPTESILRCVDRHHPHVVGLSVSTEENLPSLFRTLSRLVDEPVSVALGGQAVAGLEADVPLIASALDIPEADELPSATEAAAALAGIGQIEVRAGRSARADEVSAARWGDQVFVPPAVAR